MPADSIILASVVVAGFLVFVAALAGSAWYTHAGQRGAEPKDG